jgi:hypothetical protein
LALLRSITAAGDARRRLRRKIRLCPGEEGGVGGTLRAER